MKILLDLQAVVFKAEFAGFYKLREKEKFCYHRGCGFNPENKRCNSGQWIGMGEFVINPDHLNAGCDLDWCVIKYGPKTFVRVDCKRSSYEKYSEAELSNPDVKPQAAAIKIHIVLGTYIRTMVGLYDLFDDKWLLDTWWKVAGGNTNLLIPNKAYFPPMNVHGINEVIDALKAAI